jgi:hypothetical protein
MSMTSRMVPKHVNLTVRARCAEESVPLQADALGDLVLFFWDFPLCPCSSVSFAS